MRYVVVASKITVGVALVLFLGALLTYASLALFFWLFVQTILNPDTFIWVDYGVVFVMFIITVKIWRLK